MIRSSSGTSVCGLKVLVYAAFSCEYSADICVLHIDQSERHTASARSHVSFDTLISSGSRPVEAITDLEQEKKEAECQDILAREP